MLFSTVLASVLATAASVSAVSLDKRITHSGTATVNPNPSNALGSCGHPFKDSEYKVAISNYWMKNQSPGPYCGRKIQLTNTGPDGDNSIGGKGNTVIVTVDDTCPGCDENHLDLSVAAWKQLTNNAAYSHVGIDWHFCNANGQC